MAKGDKQDIRNAKNAASANKKLQMKVYDPIGFNKDNKKAVKSGKTLGSKATSNSIRITNTNSARQPSVASKANAKNKMKAQGGKIGLSPTSSSLERARARRGNR